MATVLFAVVAVDRAVSGDDYTGVDVGIAIGVQLVVLINVGDAVHLVIVDVIEAEQVADVHGRYR